MYLFIDEQEEVNIRVKKQALEKKPERKDISKEEKLARWRIGKEKCIMPDSILNKFPMAKLGCLVHEFSHNGKYIAAACTEMNSETHIKIFNMEDVAL